MSGDERRDHDRQPVTLIVEYQGADDLLIDYSENLSTGGIFVNTSYRFKKGESVRLVLSFPGLLQPFRVTGTVVWSRNDEEDRGIGVEFDDVESSEELEQFIEKLRAGDPNLVARRVSVLIADDNSYIAGLIEDGLRGPGTDNFKGRLRFEVKAVGDDLSALTELRKGKTDILIVDGELPTRGATHLIDVVDAEALPTTTIVISRETATLEAARQHGANFVLSKPVRLHSLLGVLRTWGTRTSSSSESDYFDPEAEENVAASGE